MRPATPILTPAPPILAAALAEDMAAERAAGGEKPTADNTLLRGSDAYACARKIGFAALRVPRVVPYSADTLMAFDNGENIHAKIQRVLVKKFDAHLEVPISYKGHGLDLSGHADGVYDSTSKRGDLTVKVVVEIKSMKTYPFNKAVGLDWGRQVTPEGPKIEHVLQAGIYARSPQLQADMLHLIYFAKEDGRIAEWLLEMDQPFLTSGETINELVAAELDRLRIVEDHLRQGLLPWRHIPGHGTVRNPPPADSKDEPWNCRYCPWQPTCAALPSSPVPVTAATDPVPDGEPF